MRSRLCFWGEPLRCGLEGLLEFAEELIDLERLKEHGGEAFAAGANDGVVGVRSTSRLREDPVLSGKRILIADDEDIIRETVRDVLVGYGCEVTAVSEGAAAIKKISAEPPFDLVLSDIKMPQKNGYEVFAAAKNANPKTPVILTTGFGYDPNHAIIRARREGLAAVLFKPFKVDQLLDQIRAALKAVPA